MAVRRPRLGFEAKPEIWFCLQARLCFIRTFFLLYHSFNLTFFLIMLFKLILLPFFIHLLSQIYVFFCFFFFQSFFQSFFQIFLKIVLKKNFFLIFFYIFVIIIIYCCHHHPLLLSLSSYVITQTIFNFFFS